MIFKKIIHLAKAYGWKEQTIAPERPSQRAMPKQLKEDLIADAREKKAKLERYKRRGIDPSEEDAVRMADLRDAGKGHEYRCLQKFPQRHCREVYFLCKEKWH